MGRMIISREQYEAIRRCSYREMELFLRKIYAGGYLDGYEGAVTRMEETHGIQKTAIKKLRKALK